MFPTLFYRSSFWKEYSSNSTSVFLTLHFWTCFFLLPLTGPLWRLFSRGGSWICRLQGTLGSSYLCVTSTSSLEDSNPSWIVPWLFRLHSLCPLTCWTFFLDPSHLLLIVCPLSACCCSLAAILSSIFVSTHSPGGVHPYSYSDTTQVMILLSVAHPQTFPRAPTPFSLIR